MNYYWFSFSNKGNNTGVCIVQSGDENNALQKTIDLDIHPPHDHIAGFRVDGLESGMVCDKLYTPEDMINLGYESSKTQIIK